MRHELASSLEHIKSDCLVLGLFADSTTTEFPAKIAPEALVTHLKSKRLTPGDTVFHIAPDLPALLLVHCGDKKNYTPEIVTDAIQKVAKSITSHHMASATIALPALPDHTPDWQVEHMLIQFETQCYQFLDLKTKKNQTHATQTIAWYLPNTTETAIHTGESVATGMAYTRDLANLPANICTPTYLAKQAQALDKEWDTISTKIMSKTDIEALGMGAFLAVAKGSAEPLQFVQMQYNGAGSEPPIVLIGKGITFDSGGISLKAPECMEEMKYDMIGAASVLGTFKACASLKLPINVIGLLACTENMPGGAATKPGDVVTSMSGQTIEITNTDAEGRLVLADALTYAKQFQPRYMIDIATLTGAIIVALGNTTTGLMSNDDQLAEKILAAAAHSQEKTWRLPIGKEYQTLLDSPAADMLNSPAVRVAGSITAACFLSRFVDDLPWAHLDIAGTAWVSGKFRCATGRPVALLVQFLRDLVQDAR
ncbi:MAG: leucyl aminopeptidase [Gammaproteobacteria bacterium]|nr:leucyl aminopeptidase [Gammaproteobacteria bacterium]